MGEFEDALKQLETNPDIRAAVLISGPPIVPDTSTR